MNTEGTKSYEVVSAHTSVGAFLGSVGSKIKKDRPFYRRLNCEEFFNEKVLAKYDDVICRKGLPDDLRNKTARSHFSKILVMAGKTATQKKSTIHLLKDYQDFIQSSYHIELEMNIPSFPLLSETERQIELLRCLRENERTTKELAESFWVSERSITECLVEMQSKNEYEGIRIAGKKIRPPITRRRNKAREDKHGYSKGSMYPFILALNIRQIEILFAALEKNTNAADKPYILSLCKSLWAQLGSYGQERVTEVASELATNVTLLEEVNDNEADIPFFQTESDFFSISAEGGAFDLIYCLKNEKILKIAYNNNGVERVLDDATIIEYTPHNLSFLVSYGRGHTMEIEEKYVVRLEIKS